MMDGATAGKAKISCPPKLTLLLPTICPAWTALFTKGEIDHWLLYSSSAHNTISCSCLWRSNGTAE